MVLSCLATPPQLPSRRTAKDRTREAGVRWGKTKCFPSGGPAVDHLDGR